MRRTGGTETSKYPEEKNRVTAPYTKMHML